MMSTFALVVGNIVVYCFYAAVLATAVYMIAHPFTMDEEDIAIEEEYQRLYAEVTAEEGGNI